MKGPEPLTPGAPPEASGADETPPDATAAAAAVPGGAPPEGAPSEDVLPEAALAEPAPPEVAPPRRRAVVASLVAWLLPGFGHVVLGQWVRGLAFALLVAATGAVGIALHGRLYWFGYGVSAAPVDPLVMPESPLLVAAASLVSIGLGLPAMALRWLAGYQGELTAPGYEYGTAFLLTAGLMNLLLVLDVWDEARR